jgi:hypothetical protein
MTLRLRRGTDLQRQSITFSEGELVYVTDTGEIYVGDGSTVGGNLIVGGGGITSALTSNLNLSGYEINGTGNIAINGIVSALAIDSGIVSVDSTLIVDNVNSAFYGSFIGDGSLITNISLGDLNDFNLGTLTPGDTLSWNGTSWINTTVNGGIVEGSDYRINIIAQDSSVLVDSSTSTITGNIFANSISYESTVDITNSLSGILGQITLANTGELQKLIFKRTDTGTTSDQVIGVVSFDQTDDGGTKTYSSMGFWHSGIYIGHSPTGGSLTSSNYVGIQDGGVAIGKFSLEAGYKLDVTGSTIFRNTAVIANSSLKLSDNRAYTSIATPSTGEIMYDTVTTTGGLYMYNNTTGWARAVVEELSENATVLSTFLKLGPSDTSTRDGFGSDSNSIDGAMFYNIDAERIQYYQADSWFNMPNQSLEEDADVRFASVTADNFISTGAGTPTLESETVIDLQAGERVRVTTSPFRLAQLTTTERNAISPVAGDLIYNTTDNRFQGYQNGAWINLDDGTAA